MKRIIIAGLVGAGLSGPALAQSTSADPNSKPQTDVGSKSGTLSDKLSDTGGVIHPQDGVDPKMQKSAPATGNMPVIHPPGTTGDGTDVQPK